MTSYPDIWNALTEQFHPSQVRERPGGGKRVFHYVTARTVANRLDKVLGFENWEDDYADAPGESGNALCRLTITLPDGRKVTKSDAGSPGNTGDDGEDDKGAVSDAFKRAAAKFGIGRYLYGEGVYTCPPPDRPALPAPTTAPVVEAAPVAPPMPPPAPAPTLQRRPDGAGSSPRTGRALFAWLKDQEQKHEVGIVKYLTGWAKLQEYPGRMVDWSPEQADQGLIEARRKLDALQFSQERGDAYEGAA